MFSFDASVSSYAITTTNNNQHDKHDRQRSRAVTRLEHVSFK